MSAASPLDAALNYLADTKGRYPWRAAEKGLTGWGFAQSGYRTSKVWPTLVDALVATLTELAEGADAEATKAERTAEKERSQAREARKLAAALGAEVAP